MDATADSTLRDGSGLSSANRRFRWSTAARAASSSMKLSMEKPLYELPTERA